MNTNNAITAATVEAALRAIITAKGGDELITCSTRSLEQANIIADAIATAAGYDETKLTEEVLEVALLVAGCFNKDSITGEVVDGLRLPMTDEELAAFHRDYIPQITKDYPVSSVLLIKLIAKILNDVKQFTR